MPDTTIEMHIVRTDADDDNGEAETELLARFDADAVHALRAALGAKNSRNDYGPETAHGRLLDRIDEVL